MKLTARAGRITAAVAIASAAIALPTVALATTAAPGHSAVQSSAAPRCRAAATEVWLGLNPDGGAAGTTYYPIEFTNVSQHTCSLFGYPGVSAITKSGHQLGPAAGHNGTRRTVNIKPGGSAHAQLGIVEDGVISGCHAATAYGLEVYPPNQTVKQPIYSFTFPACHSKVFMHVSQVMSGIGIP